MVDLVFDCAALVAVVMVFFSEVPVWREFWSVAVVGAMVSIIVLLLGVVALSSTMFSIAVSSVWVSCLLSNVFALPSEWLAWWSVEFYRGLLALLIVAMSVLLVMIRSWLGGVLMFCLVSVFLMVSKSRRMLVL